MSVCASSSLLLSACVGMSTSSHGWRVDNIYAWTLCEGGRLRKERESREWINRSSIDTRLFQQTCGLSHECNVKFPFASINSVGCLPYIKIAIFSIGLSFPKTLVYCVQKPVLFTLSLLN